MTALSRSRALGPPNPPARYYRLRVYILRRCGTRRAMTGGMSGYHDCACRDCFEIAVGEHGCFCADCAEAGCEPFQECRCERLDDATGGQLGVAAMVPSPPEREARIWAVLEPELSAGFGPLHIYTTQGSASQWCARLGNGPEHFGESRLDALAQLAQVVALR